MNKNVGQLDRIIRLTVGVVLVLLAITGVIGWWGWLGIVLIITGATKTCPAYSALGVNTCKNE
ncbi:MAG TPA: DUF2892 domain-containing protein [Alcanivoracaceae bacterium]|nr:DUF2892 domain-containing protein [Alcanivoracaceae bacterium]